MSYGFRVLNVGLRDPAYILRLHAHGAQTAASSSHLPTEGGQ